MSSQRTYPATPWVDPRTEVKASAIQGLGVFAREPIAEGEVVVVSGGQVWRREEATPERVRTRTLIVVGEDLYLGTPADSPATPDEFLNHSCDANLWMTDEVTMTARRPIPAGAEVTADMATHQFGDTVLLDRCRCGSPACRGRVTGADWRRPDVQRRYAGHFCPYLNRRIAGLALSTDADARAEPSR